MEKRAREFAASWGRWSGKRELVRGLFHASIGLTGWVLLHPLRLDADLITFLLCAVSFIFIVLEGARLAIGKWRNTEWYARLLRWVDNRLVKKFLTRETENQGQTTIIPSVLGLSVAWIIGPRWICAVVALYFGLIDPLAKLGKYWPIKVFNNGRAKGKSLGGLLFGFLAGLCSLVLVLWVNGSVPVLPHNLSQLSAVWIFAAGLFSASLFELVGGKLDNFLIPAGSAAVMTALYNLFFC